MGLLDRLFSGGEQNVIGSMGSIIEIAKNENKALLDILDGKEKSLLRIKALEQESDNKVFELTNVISSGAISPNVLADMLALVEKEDDISDAIFNLAREMMRYDMPDKKMSKMLRDNIEIIIGLVEQALVELGKMENTANIAEMRKSRREIEVLEQRGDEIKDSLLDFVYKNGIDFKAFNYISEVAHKCDDILDNCEDSADIFMSIMLSIMT
jgi:uncharacterized protein Yka (UPF0111/DUF47 family)